MEIIGLKHIKVILTGKTKVSAIVVDKDFELDSGRIHVDAHGYPVIHRWSHSVLKRQYLARYILGVTDPKVVVDHINGDPLDNRRSNLRKCTQADNCSNRSDSGVYRTKEGSWVAEWTYKGCSRYVGTYKTKPEAKEACEADKERIRGVFYRPPNRTSRTSQGILSAS